MAEYDVIIIGAGAAGLTAAMYAARQNWKTLVLSQDIGGQAATTALIENYPGVEKIDGLDLMMKFKHQAANAGAQISLEEVTSINQVENGFQVTSSLGVYHARALILSQGLTHKHIGVPGEEALIGKGVSYCAACDAPLFKGKKVAVVGGGNSAMDAALTLSTMCPQVTIITVNPDFHGEKILIERLRAASNIECAVQATTKSIQGSDRVTGLEYEVDGELRTAAVEGVFVEIGYTVNPKLMQHLVTLDGKNQVVINHDDNSTNIPGLFAAGDVTTIRQKQVVISAGEGAKAALGVTAYLQQQDQTLIKPIDWGDGVPMRHELSST